MCASVHARALKLLVVVSVVITKSCRDAMRKNNTSFTENVLETEDELEARFGLKKNDLLGMGRE